MERALLCIDAGAPMPPSYVEQALLNNGGLWEGRYDLKCVAFALDVHESGHVGRGGTDAQCVVNYMREHGYKKAFIISDGFFTMPTDLEGLDITVIATLEDLPL